MAGHMSPAGTPEPMDEFRKNLLLASLQCYLTDTPNIFLKMALSNCLLPEILQEGEEYAYLAEYNVLYTQALKCLKVDDKHRFSILLTKHRDLIEKFPPLGLFEDVCKHKAVGCASVFLQSGLSLDLNTEFEDSPFRPLDYGALHLSPSLTELLLQNGANPDIHSCYGSPLVLALRELCYNDYVKQWKPDKSIFKLLYILCLPELNEPFATIKLLASHTKQIEEVYAYLIERGDVVKLASLLIAAKDQLLVPSAEGGLETTPIGQYILRKLKLDSDQESQFMTDSKTTGVHQSKPVVERFKNAYNVVKIMWKAVDILDSYRNSEWIKNVLDYEVPFDIAHDLVNDAKLVLNPEDVCCNDIECLRPMITSKAEVLSKRICFEKQLRSSSSLHPLVGVQNPAMGMSLFSSLSMASFPHHSYHTWQAVNFNIVKPVEFQSTHVKPSSCNFKTSARPATSLGTSQFPSSSSMSTPHHTFHASQAVNFCKIKPVGINNVSASARVCAPLIWIAKRSIK